MRRSRTSNELNSPLVRVPPPNRPPPLRSPSTSCPHSCRPSPETKSISVLVKTETSALSAALSAGSSTSV